VTRRVLVVDDVDEMRVLIRRILGARGYEVDVASTLDQARRMEPAGYDAVLLDAHLGAERGTDLIDTMRSADPTAPGRCLVITGGAADGLPDGVACLAKPFRPDELFDAVRALAKPAADSNPGPEPHAAPEPAAKPPEPAAKPPEPAAKPPEPAVQPPEPARPPPSQDSSTAPGAWPLLGIVRRSRVRERQELADFLHDGPIQELAAAVLEMHAIRQTAPACLDRQLDEIAQRIDAAAGSLRWLIDRHWSLLSSQTDLAAAVHERTSGLLAGPPTVDAGRPQAALSRSDVPVIADVVELLLTEIALAQAGRAHVTVRADEHMIHVGLALSAPADDQPMGDQVAAQAALDALAVALGASVRAEFTEQRWRLRFALPRSAG
jgi:CheY-like chemotaxis protein